MIEGEIERQRTIVADGRRGLKNNSLLYALRLNGDRYYIGRTNDAIVRIKQHMDGKGAQWTKLYAPVALIECKPCKAANPQEADQMETLWTLEYMVRFGWRNVRGGYFCHVDELLTEQALRAHCVFESLQNAQPRMR
jgi:predicted GIY-YIG superfamily endonuclease